ncbi:ImmA/IrrE family metallo-endopeptidase [Butyrivibrio sp. AC2005]|uniref:ImmA/IrrE family metallo-endopeptidase n=1 Tax=Butyrivibrio sp. AC2005 TaxID=1280672 RepID=UPI00047BA6AC|nr:ImmA/IrrE family metallo-endopeptidase [Butyrivibrio sp. AC2005]
MIRTYTLNAEETEEVKQLATKTRQDFGVFPTVPLGSDIRMILEKEGILLCEYPFGDSCGTHTYGNITWFKTDETTITFIGLNTSSYYDEQIFALAHEIYHFRTKTGKAYSPEMELEDEVIEKKADRFAAELLLPADELKKLVLDTFGKYSITDNSELKVLRFIARLQCEWWLPYKALVNRIFEEGYISEEFYTELYGIECRDEDSIYRRILKSADNEISELLNKKTKTIGVSNKVLETIISNYEDKLIGDDEFVQLLSLFDKRPEDYGFQIIDEIDDELKEYFESGEK